MSFHKVLERLREVTQEPLPEKQRGLGTRRIVEVRDLAELLHHFDRLDAEARMGYPPHIKELADAAEKALFELRACMTRDTVVHLEHALHLVRPNAALRGGEAVPLESTVMQLDEK